MAHTRISPPTPRVGLRPVDVVVFLGIVGVAYALAVTAAHWTEALTPESFIDLAPSALPGYAVASLIRMALAYLLSLTFSLMYARLAASSTLAEGILLPVLDLLQSIPILSFMPGVVLALLVIFPRSNVGLELAAVLLIVTSQAWNLAFSFFQSLRTIPKDLLDAANLFRLEGWRRFSRLELPVAMVGLVWNSMMSWANGWFFLMATEQFTLGEQDFRLPGLGSYLRTAADAGNLAALGLGLATLVLLIVLLDQLLWRPLLAWSERFNLGATAAEEAVTSPLLSLLRRSSLLEWLGERVVGLLLERLDRWLGRVWGGGQPAAPAPAPKGLSTGRIVGMVAMLVLAAGALWGIVAGVRLLSAMDAATWLTLLPATAASLLRVVAALVIGLAWTVPVGVAIGIRPALARRVQPLVQLVASVPATALFPAFLLALLALPAGLDVAAVALMLFATQWYILFNVIAGAQSIPPELKDAALLFKLRGWQRWRRLILPAILPYLVTGMVTATGGSWNASIVAEYVTFAGKTYVGVGLGSFIAVSAGAGDYAGVAAGTLVMAVVVVAINRLLWQRLYALAERRYRLD